MKDDVLEFAIAFVLITVGLCVWVVILEVVRPGIWGRVLP